MRARTSLAAGFVLLTLVNFGCKSQSAQSTGSPMPSAPQAPIASPPSQSPSQATLGQPAQVNQPDDASLLARKTSEYASSMSRVLAQGPSMPATQPSIVQWVQPPPHQADASTVQPAPPLPAQASPMPNQPATLAVAHLKEDTTVPLILPESADQIPTAPATPADSTGAAPVMISTDDYELKMRKLVADYPQDLGNQLDYQLLRLVRDEPTPDLSVVSQLSGEDRDILLALMDGLTNFRAAAKGDGNLMLNRKIQPLLEMAERLRTQGQLAIPTVAFCAEVDSFGVYRPMPSSRFPAGRVNDLIVYHEAANFTSVQGNDTIWRTRLRQEMILYTDTGLAVWPEKSNSSIYLDESRHRRHDFFISRMVRLPSSLAAGKYVLKIILTDEESNRVVEASSPLEIVSNSDTQTTSADSTSTATPAADRSSP
jgi:hypothetical protein